MKMKMKMKMKLPVGWRITSFVLFASISYMQETLACEPPIAYITLPTQINIDPSLPIGTVLGTSTVSSDNPAYSSANCDWGTGGTSVREYAVGVGTLVGENLYPTSVNGVSYRIKILGTGSWPFPNVYAPAVGNGGNIVPWSVTLPDGHFSAIYITLELVKTGPMQAGGTFYSQPVLIISKHRDGLFNTGELLPFYKVIMTGSVNIQPETPTCLITNSNISVSLDEVNQTMLGSTGNTAGDKTFNIPLNCTSSANISLYFSGDMADTSKAVFKNTNAVNTNSVGVQLLDATSVPVPTTIGSYVNVGIVNGAYNYPVTARYYALGAGNKIGDVNTIAYASVVYN